ncbi:MAG: zinc ribbon domain-containing protein [Gallionella sp.]|nr:zinc ribbon domain-containing protein [Gallionella sp.]MDD4945977.1 zinc ribbon domain-containing protein [Gallionella sp.]
MALIKCRECGHEVSDTAKTCPNCGAKPKVSRTFLKYAVGFLALLFVLAVVGQLSGQSPTPPTSAEQAPISQPKESPVNFDIPLETTAGTLVCPLSAALDNREGHGLQAAMKSRREVFGRQEDAEKAGCQEWREGLPVQLSDKEKQQAKGWQVEHTCGMLTFAAGFVFSCDLRNSTDSNSSPQAAKPTNQSGSVRLKWEAPATLSGTLASGVFDNCCVNGEASKQKYIYLRPDSKVSIEPNDEDEPGIENVEAIQIGGIFPNVRDGQHIVVQCKQVWPGNTGHYALPVYCNEPTVQ